MRYPPNDDPLTALRIGELDCAPTKYEGTTSAVLDPFRDDPQYGMISEDAGFSVPLYFNISRGGALADVRFRRACLHAIDRDDMVTRLLTGNGLPGKPGWLPQSHAFYEPAARDYPFDKAEAERLLDEAGYRRTGGGDFRKNPDGSPLRYTLHFPNVVPTAVAELTAASLKAVGIDVDLQVIELVQLFGMKLQGTGYDLLVTTYPGPAGTAPNGDADSMRLIYHSHPPGTTFVKANGYSNPEVDRLLDAQIQTLDVEARKQQFSQVQKLVAEDLPVAMLYYTKLWFVYRKAVFDPWYYTPGGFGTGIDDVYNKHVYVTGRKTGLEIRQA
jgi:peptide/nickel transport system substrate-binding protein